MQIHQEDWIVTLTIQPRPQDFSLKKWVGWERPHLFIKGKALGTRLVNDPLLFLLFSFDLLIRSSIKPKIKSSFPTLVCTISSSRVVYELDA